MKIIQKAKTESFFYYITLLMKFIILISIGNIGVFAKIGVFQSLQKPLRKSKND